MTSSANPPDPPPDPAATLGRLAGSLGALTQQVADWLVTELAPKGVGVVLEAEHLCLSLRGACKPGTRTVTSALRGAVRDDPRTRQEFLDLARRRAA